VALGLSLVGIQQQALTQVFGWLVHSHRFFPLLNTLGVVLLAAAALMVRTNDTAPQMKMVATPHWEEEVVS